MAKLVELPSQHQSLQWIFRMISFRIDWFDLLAIQETLKSLLQHQLKSISSSSCTFISQLSHLYMTTGKTIALTKRTFEQKVMFLLLNILSRLAIALFPKSKCLNFLTSVMTCSDFGAQENKDSHCFHCLPIYLLWSDGTRCHDLGFLNVEF